MSFASFKNLIMVVPLILTPLSSVYADRIYENLERQNEIIAGIKNDFLRDKTKLVLLKNDMAIANLSSSSGNVLDEVALGAAKDCFSYVGNSYSEPIRKKEIISELGPCVSESSRIFKIYVKKGRFGDYNSGKPIIVPSNYVFISKDGLEIKTRERIVLPAYKNSRFISVCVSYKRPDILDANTVFNETIDSIEKIAYDHSNKHMLHVTNVLPITFVKVKHESDEELRERMVKEIKSCSNGVLSYAAMLQFYYLPIPNYGRNQFDVTDETATDANTGLMWSRNGGLAPGLTLEEAKDWVKTINIGGYKDWRLPTVSELASLDLAQDVLNAPHAIYWSSDEDASSWGYVRVYDGRKSLFFIFEKEKAAHVWPVRNANPH